MGFASYWENIQERYWALVQVVRDELLDLQRTLESTSSHQQDADRSANGQWFEQQWDAVRTANAQRAERQLASIRTKCKSLLEVMESLLEYATNPDFQAAQRAFFSEIRQEDMISQMSALKAKHEREVTEKDEIIADRDRRILELGTERNLAREDCKKLRQEVKRLSRDLATAQQIKSHPESFYGKGVKSLRK